MPFREQGVVRIHLPRSHVNELCAAIRTCVQRQVGLLLPTTAGWSEAAACLVFQPGAREPSAIAASNTPDRVDTFNAAGERLLGCFVGILPGVNSDQGVRMVEDGYVLTLSSSMTTALLTALASGRDFEVPGQNDLLPASFQLCG